ncbi:MAG TPA: hypothetical protein VFV38_51265 [Ktedonobacteraceae bacterium]|nr:hypothetical protein [Ktedonobacteraceae bacterium]
MPPIDNLLCFWCPFTGPLGIVAATITTDPLDTRVGFQPGGEHFRGPFRQQINWPVSASIDEDRAILAPTAKGKTIHPLLISQ